MRDMAWYFHRLRAMEPREVLCRVGKSVKHLHYRFVAAQRRSLLDSHKINLSHVEEVKERLRSLFKSSSYALPVLPTALEWSIYGRKLDLASPIDWHQSNASRWDPGRFCLDYETVDISGTRDIRYTWELNRQQFLPYLAALYAQTEKEEYIQAFSAHFYSWIAENPYLTGVNWYSAMEVALRAYQWAISASILADVPREDLIRDLIVAVIRSIEYVAGNISSYSSANNHLIVEAAVMSIVGWIVNPVWNQTWFENGLTLLEENFPRQVHRDGVSKEQALWYHAFVLDMMLQYNFFLRRVGHPTLHDDIIRRMAYFLAAIAEGTRSIPRIGDSDDGRILNVFAANSDYHTYVLELASLYLGERLGIRSVRDPQALYIAQTDGRDVYLPASKFAVKDLEVFEEGGYVLMRDGPVYIIFDAGPLGYGSIAAHGHADALSVLLYYYGYPVIVDAGTYTYNAELSWRHHFKSTASHNTLVVSKQDQSTYAGPFLWTRKATGWLLDWGETDQMMWSVGCHDGYAPAIHRRAISVLKNEGLAIICDEFEGEGELNFLFETDIVLRRVSEQCVHVRPRGGEWGLYFTSSASTCVVERWIAKGFLNKQTTTGIRIQHNFSSGRVLSCISRQPCSLVGAEIKVADGRVFRYDSYKRIWGMV